MPSHVVDKLWINWGACFVSDACVGYSVDNNIRVGYYRELRAVLKTDSEVIRLTAVRDELLKRNLAKK